MKKLEVKHDTTEHSIPITITKKCDTCDGTGEVTTMEYVYPNEPHMAPIGTKTCIDCNGSGEVQIQI